MLEFERNRMPRDEWRLARDRDIERRVTVERDLHQDFYGRDKRYSRNISEDEYTYASVLNDLRVHLPRNLQQKIRRFTKRGEIDSTSAAAIIEHGLSHMIKSQLSIVAESIGKDDFIVLRFLRDVLQSTDDSLKGKVRYLVRQLDPEVRKNLKDGLTAEKTSRSSQKHAQFSLVSQKTHPGGVLPVKEVVTSNVARKDGFNKVVAERFAKSSLKGGRNTANSEAGIKGFHNVSSSRKKRKGKAKSSLLPLPTVLSDEYLLGDWKSGGNAETITFSGGLRVYKGDRFLGQGKVGKRGFRIVIGRKTISSFRAEIVSRDQFFLWNGNQQRTVYTRVNKKVE